jgi:hypothetical protein
MRRGYIRLYRKIQDCEVLKEKNKRYSKLEAWIYLILSESQGIDGNGLKRGEFEVSIRYLAEKWRWSKSAVERFMADLQKGDDPMIKRLGHLAGHLAGQSAGHFIICKYDTYNPTRDSQRDTSRDSQRDKVKEVLNKEKVSIKESCPPETADTRVLFEIYDQENKKLPPVTRTSDRTAKCRSRINQALRKGCLEQYLKDFRAAVAKAQRIPFLCGQKGWRAHFDWFIANSTNVYGILEGKYDSSAEPTLPYKRDTVGAPDEVEQTPEQIKTADILREFYGKHGRMPTDAEMRNQQAGNIPGGSE